MHYGIWFMYIKKITFSTFKSLYLEWSVIKFLVGVMVWCPNAPYDVFKKQLCSMGIISNTLLGCILGILKDFPCILDTMCIRTFHVFWLMAHAVKNGSLTQLQEYLRISQKRMSNQNLTRLLLIFCQNAFISSKFFKETLVCKESFNLHDSSIQYATLFQIGCTLC